jgi:hypothetical protein
MGKGDVKRLFELGPSSPRTSRGVDKENVRVEKEWQELLPPSVCLVSPEEGGSASSIFESQTQELTEMTRPCSGFVPIDGNISVILHQHDPTIPTYSSRDSIASLILKNPSQGLDANKGLLFDYEEQDDRLTEEAFPGDEGDAYVTARRRESYLDTADSESESDNDMNMDTDMSTDKDLQTRRSTSIEVHVSPETSEPEDTFETPRPPSKVRAARRVSLTVSTSRLKTLEREHAAIAIQPNQEGEKGGSTSPTSSTSTVVVASAIVRPSEPGMWRQSYGTDSVASDDGDIAIGLESRTSELPAFDFDNLPVALRQEHQGIRVTLAECEDPSGVTDSVLTRPIDTPGCATKMEAKMTFQTEGSSASPPTSSASSEDIETPTTPKAVHRKIAHKPDDALFRSQGSGRSVSRESLHWTTPTVAINGTPANRQDVMLSMGIDRPCPSTTTTTASLGRSFPLAHNQKVNFDVHEPGSASSRATVGARLRRKSLRNIFGAAESHGPGKGDRGRNEPLHTSSGEREPPMKRSMPSLRSAAAVNDSTTPAPHVRKPMKKFSFSSLSRAFRWSSTKSTTDSQASHVSSATSDSIDVDVDLERSVTPAVVTHSAAVQEGSSSFQSISKAFASPTSTLADDCTQDKIYGTGLPVESVVVPPPKLAQGPARRLTFSSAFSLNVGQQEVIRQTAA